MKYITVKKNSFNDTFIKYHIDAPVENFVYSDSFVFSGWIFSTKANEFRIKIIYPDTELQEYLNVCRGDVVAHFTKNSDEILPPIKCGFNFTLNSDAKIIIYCCNEIVIEISFSIIDVASEINWPLLDKLNDAHLNNNPELIIGKELELLKNSPYKYIGNSLHELTKAYWIPQKTRNNILKFIEYASSFDFGPNIVESSLINGVIKVPSPIHINTVAYCDCSFYIAPFNYLRFISNGDVFYIVQHFSFCDALYIPKLDFHHFLSIGIDKNEWHKNIENSTLSYNKKIGGLNSVFAMHNRPYHYNYDISLGLHLLNERGLLEKIPLLTLHEGKSFFRPSKLVNNKINELILNDDDFTSHLNKPGFSILAGHQITHSAKESVYRDLFADFDLTIRNNNLTIPHSDFVGKICKELNQCTVRLWFGITSQKRKLINQEEEISRTINIFCTMFDSVGVIIDGWTSPLKKSEGDIKQIESDNYISEAIKKSLKYDNVSYHSIIGLTTEEKLKITQFIDVFLANHGAGSMHIDRMGNRYGVTHNSNIWSAADLAHIHNNSIKINQKDIIDFEPTDKAQDCVDYSVTPKIIAKKMLQQYFNSIDNK
ncbi:hypothetical protein ACEUB5_20675 [Aeromonas veronii]